MTPILLYLGIVLMGAVLLYVLPGIVRHFAAEKADVDKIVHYLSVLIFMIYIGCVLYITIFSRVVQYRQPYFDPLWKLRKAIDIQGYTITIHIAELFDPILNIIMFIPLGYLLPWCIKKLRNHSLWVIMIGCICSAMIELTQHFAQRGAFETGDIMFNTIGCMLGVCIFKVFLEKVLP